MFLYIYISDLLRMADKILGSNHKSSNHYFFHQCFKDISYFEIEMHAIPTNIVKNRIRVS